MSIRFIYSDAFIGFCVVFCIYQDILKMLFYIFGTCPRSVNNFRTISFFEMLEIFGPKCPPPTPYPRRQCQSSLLGGKICIKKKGFYGFNEKKGKMY